MQSQENEKISQIFFNCELVTMEKPNTLCLNNDQQFQTSWLLKPERIVNKEGDRNVGSVHVPQKSARFLKDIVHTLVRKLDVFPGDKINLRTFLRLKPSGDGCWRFTFLHISRVGLSSLVYITQSDGLTATLISMRQGKD